MDGLYPIIRRVRRPLLPVEPEQRQQTAGDGAQTEHGRTLTNADGAAGETPHQGTEDTEKKREKPKRKNSRGGAESAEREQTEDGQ